MSEAEENPTITVPDFTPLDDIENALERLGVSVTELCIEAGVNPATLYRWFKEEPKTFQILRQLFTAIAVIEAELVENENE